MDASERIPGSVELINKLLEKANIDLRFEKAPFVVDDIHVCPQRDASVYPYVDVIGGWFKCPKCGGGNYNRPIHSRGDFEKLRRERDAHMEYCDGAPVEERGDYGMTAPKWTRDVEELWDWVP